jgi:hypothetical protein
MIDAPDEIQANYRLAKDRDEYITIAAELNDCPSNAIRAILGLPKTKAADQHLKPERKKSPRTNLDAVGKCVLAGMTTRQIAAKLNITYPTARKCQRQWHEKTYPDIPYVPSTTVKYDWTAVARDADGGMTRAELMAKYDMPTSTVDKFLWKHKRERKKESTD